MEGNISPCPQCNKYASEAYKKGCEDTIKWIEEVLQKKRNVIILENVIPTFLIKQNDTKIKGE